MHKNKEIFEFNEQESLHFKEDFCKKSIKIGSNLPKIYQNMSRTGYRKVAYGNYIDARINNSKNLSNKLTKTTLKFIESQPKSVLKRVSTNEKYISYNLDMRQETWKMFESKSPWDLNKLNTWLHYPISTIKEVAKRFWNPIKGC